MGRSETIELTGKFIEFPDFEEPAADAVSAILPVNFVNTAEIIPK